MGSATYACLVLLVLNGHPSNGIFYRQACSCAWRFSGQCKWGCDHGDFVFGTSPCGFGLFGTCCVEKLPCSAYGGVCRSGSCNSDLEVPFTYKVRCPGWAPKCCVIRAARDNRVHELPPTPRPPTPQPPAPRQGTGNIQCGRRVSSRVLGGGAAASSCQWPWMVSIKLGSPTSPGIHVCAGVLVSDNKVLTTANCVSGRQVYVTVGEFNINSRDDSQVDIAVTKDVHENFATAAAGGNIQANDIAILTLDRTSMGDGSCVTPVCLPRAVNSISPTSQCYIAGWGINRQSDGLLHEANVNVLNNAVCSPLFPPGRYPSDKICTSPLRDSVNACPGDNGGMLVCKDTGFVWSVFGLISDNACIPPLPVIYTNVQNHLNWIQARL